MSNPTFDRDDPRLTAYALDELSDAERPEVEALLAANADARKFVTEMQETASALESSYLAEPLPELSDDQRGELEQQLIAPRQGIRSGFFKTVIAAAALVIASIGLALWSQVGEQPAPFMYAFFGDESQKSSVLRATLPAENRRARPDQFFAYSVQSEAERPAADPVAGRRLSARERKQLEALGYVRGVSASADAERLRELGYVGADDDGADRRLVEPEAEIVEEERIVPGEHDTEGYAHVEENAWRLAAREPLSTFSIDVDTASYSNMRRFLNEGRLPPPSSVRIEEFINYFSYDDPAPLDDAPFRTTTEVASCPWQPRHRLVRIGIKAKEIDWSERKPSNLVFLLDVSGSMNSPDKLPLLQRSLKLLVEQLDERDRVAIAVYAGASGLVLPSTPAERSAEILAALERLSAGGSTNGGAGIELAYKIATEQFIDGGINRVILATDGDFNVGVTDHGSLVGLIEEKRETGVFLSVLGFGTGNLKDSTMELLADKGNGQFAYIDSIAEAKKVLVSEMGGTLIPVAKDVKIQVEFNPARVSAWRLIGYENRQLAHQDFNDDTKDAGEIGAGHSVTALYQVVPPEVPFEGPSVDPLRYDRTDPAERSSGASFSDELMYLKLRYKEPDGQTSRLITTPVEDRRQLFHEASQDLRFSAAVAGFGLLLRDSRYLDEFDCSRAYQIAWESRGEDPGGHRKEFLRLLQRARELRDEPR